MLPNGKIIISAWSSFTENRFHAMQLDSIGTLDSLYANNGSYYDAVLPSTGFPVVVSSVVDGSGNLFMSGSLDNSNVYVLKLSPTGVVDSTFGVNGIFNYTFNGRVKGMKLMENGNILLPGSNYNSMYGIGCALMIQPDGTLDSTFGVNGLRDFNFNDDSGTHWMEALLELSNGDWIAASSTGGFVFRKYADSSSLPFVSESNGVLTTIEADSYQWYFNNEPIPNATANSYTALESGAYTVMTTNSDGCSGLSSVYTVVSNGVGAENVSGFAIYPNPSNGIFTLKGSNLQGELQRVEIKNTLGESVYSLNQAQFNQVVDIQNCPTGVYLVELYFSSGKEVIKVLKTQ